MMEVEDQWISFIVGNETYVHPIKNIREIIPYTANQDVPGGSVETEGVLNVRGTVLTVFSGRSLFSEPPAEPDSNWKVIIIEVGKVSVGISVDAVGNIVAFKDDQAEWMDKKSDDAIIRGTVHLNERLYILTDLITYFSERHVFN